MPHWNSCERVLSVMRRAAASSLILLAQHFSETDSRLISKREDFENLSVAPSLAIGAATMCHILCKALRVFHLRQGSSLPPMDVSIIRKKFDALDASAKNRVMRLFALAGFPTIRHQFVFASTPLVTVLVDKVISQCPYSSFERPSSCSLLSRLLQPTSSPARSKAGFWPGSFRTTHCLVLRRMAIWT